MGNVDFQKIKILLVQEYRENGGKNDTEFIRGMTYLQDYLGNLNEDAPLNEDLPLLQQIRILNNSLIQKGKEIEELNKLLKQKKAIIKDYRSMSKAARKKLRENIVIQELKKKNEELTLKIIQLTKKED